MAGLPRRLHVATRGLVQFIYATNYVLTKHAFLSLAEDMTVPVVNFCSSETLDVPATNLEMCENSRRLPALLSIAANCDCSDNWCIAVYCVQNNFTTDNACEVELDCNILVCVGRYSRDFKCNLELTVGRAQVPAEEFTSAYLFQIPLEKALSLVEEVKMLLQT